MTSSLGTKCNMPQEPGNRCRDNRDAPRRQIFCLCLLSCSYCGHSSSCWRVSFSATSPRTLGSLPRLACLWYSYHYEICFGRTFPSRQETSRVQSLLCKNLVHLDVGRPPNDLTATGTLGELCGFRVGYQDDDCAPRVSYQPGLAVPPRARSTPVDTASCLPPEARGMAETWRRSLLRD